MINASWEQLKHLEPLPWIAFQNLTISWSRIIDYRHYLKPQQLPPCPAGTLEAIVEAFGMCLRRNVLKAAEIFEGGWFTPKSLPSSNSTMYKPEPPHPQLTNVYVLMLFMVPAQPKTVLEHELIWLQYVYIFHYIPHCDRKGLILCKACDCTDPCKSWTIIAAPCIHDHTCPISNTFCTTWSQMGQNWSCVKRTVAQPL